MVTLPLINFYIIMENLNYIPDFVQYGAIGIILTVLLIFFWKFIRIWMNEKTDIMEDQNRLEELFRTEQAKTIQVLVKVIEQNNSVIAAHNEIHKEFILAMKKFQLIISNNKNV